MPFLSPSTGISLSRSSFSLFAKIDTETFVRSMEIGSAYALQVCLIQAPAMLAFTAFYSIGKISMEHKAFTYVFFTPTTGFALISSRQARLSSLGCDCDHFFSLPLDVYVHRSSSELLPWYYPLSQVSPLLYNSLMQSLIRIPTATSFCSVVSSSLRETETQRTTPSSPSPSRPSSRPSAPSKRPSSPFS